MEKCSDCENGKLLKIDDDGYLSCIDISTEDNLGNCEIYEINDPYKCLVCDSNTYPKNDKCENLES